MEKIEIKYDSLDDKYVYPHIPLQPGVTYAFEAVSEYNPLMQAGSVTTVSTRLTTIAQDIDSLVAIKTLELHHNLETFIYKNDSVQWYVLFQVLDDATSIPTIETVCTAYMNSFNVHVGTEVPEFTSRPIYFDTDVTSEDSDTLSTQIGETAPSESWGKYLKPIINFFKSGIHLDSSSWIAIIAGAGLAILLKMKTRK